MATVETVTVLLTDLVGSTGLELRIGPAAADRLRREHFGLIRAAVEESGGRAVKNTGDGLMAAFHSSAAALSCAVSAQQRFEWRNRSADQQLLLKVGLSVGDATAQDGDYFGLPVIEAARLCERCAAGQILTTELVAQLVAGRGFEVRSFGELELKGFEDPLATVEVVWQPRGDDRASVPLPRSLREASPGEFVGRAREAALLVELFGQAAAGERRIALLSGEPGIGKTRLAAHVALKTRASGAVVLYGRCDEDLGVPYGPWVEALAHYVEHAPEEVLRSHVARHGGELSRLVPALQIRLPGTPPALATDPDTERYMLWRAVIGMLGEAADHEPLMLVLDDLHWADKPTLHLLRHVLMEGQGLRALIIGNYRESDVHRGHPLSAFLADLHREGGIERLPIRGLAQPEIVELMERAGGYELDATGVALSHELFRETDGNPFYAAELMRHLLESGTIYRQESGRFTVRGSLSRLGLPQSVREVLGRRVARLGQHAHDALSAAAVIGREFEIDVLAAVTETHEDELLDLLELAVAASVLVESASGPGHFLFAHALINRTLYEELGTTRRARLHGRVAEALEVLLGPDPGTRIGELAYHCARAATTVEHSKAVAYARRAGERALAELAPDEALRWFSQGLDLLGSRDDPGERCDLLIGLGQAQRQTGNAEFRATLLEASGTASELEDADRAARAALANNRGQVSISGRVDAERLEALERALELDNLANVARCAILISLQALELQYDPDHERRRALANRALTLAREAADARTLTHVLINYITACCAPDTLEARRGLADELLVKAKETQDPALEFWAAWAARSVHLESGDFRHAEVARERIELISAELCQPSLSWFAKWAAAGWAHLKGELAHAEQLAEQAFALGTDSGEPDAIMIYGSQLAAIRFHQGRGEEVIEMIEYSVAANPGIPAWQAGLASCYCWLGRYAEAAALVEPAARDGFGEVRWDQQRLTTLALYADAVTQADLPKAAATLYTLMEPWADQFVWTGATGYAHCRSYLGLLAATLGWDERADQHFALACEFHDANGMAFWSARIRLRWAEALARRGDGARAERQAAIALERAREPGYAFIEAAAAAMTAARSRTEA